MATGCWCAKIQIVPPSQQALASYADGLSRQIRGRVIRVRELPPQQDVLDHDKETGWWPEKEEDEEAAAIGLLSADIQVDSIEEVTPDISRMVPMTGGVRINVIPDKSDNRGQMNSIAAVDVLPTLRCGDIVEAPMRIKLAERYRDPGAWQYADYLLAQGIGAHASVRASKIAVLNVSDAGLATRADRAAQLQCEVYAAQSWASRRMFGYVHSKANRMLPKVLRLDPDDAGMLNAMLFGDRAGLNKTQRVGFERTGSFHLFVVSGMHVGLLAGLVFWLARRLKLRDSSATFVTIGLTFGYALLTGFGAPVQRALFMTVVFLSARLLSRDRNVLNALGAAALGVLVGSPGALFEASFQMTFLAIVAIGGIAIPLGERSFLPYARAAEDLWDKWHDNALPPRVAQFRVMLRLWSESRRQQRGRLGARPPFPLCPLGTLGAGTGAGWRGRGDGDGAPNGSLLPSRNDVCRPDEHVECAAGGGPGSDSRGDILCVAHEPLDSDAARCNYRSVTARSVGVIGRVSAVHAADLRIPAPGMVDLTAGDHGLGLLLLGRSVDLVDGRGLHWFYFRSLH